MKKFLSLVLALVMTMSLVTIGASAGFTDKADIDYGEAIDVINAIDVISGYADGSMRPDAPLTRGAAAKIICNMLMGPTAASALAVKTAPYTDVAPDSTFAGYIAYCANEGIVSGYADGSFRPGATLTGYAFMKMLLGALGYDSQVEGYVGTNWSVSVAKRALMIDLDDGLEDTFNGTRSVTRQEACLYAFNTLKADMVTYPDSVKVNVGGAEVVTGGKAVAVSNKTEKDYHGADHEDADDVMQFCEQYFKKLTLEDTSDNFGRAAHKWVLDGDKIGSYNNSPKVTITKAMKESEIDKLLKDYKLVDGGDYEIGDDTNGSTIANKWVVRNTPAGQNKNTGFNCAGKRPSEWFAGVTGNGTVVEVYANSKKVISNIVVITYQVDEVKNISTNNKGDVTYTIGTNNWVDYNADSVKDDQIKVHGSVVKGDYVTWTKGKSGLVHIYPTVKESGTITKVSKDDDITMSGTTRGKAACYAGSPTVGTGSIWIDQFGYVAKSNVNEASDVVFMVTNWEETNKGKTTYYAQIVDGEGRIEELVTDNKDYTTKKPYTYTTVDGKAVFRAYTGGTAETAAMTENQAKLGGYYVHSDVTFVFMQNEGPDLKASTSTGMQKMTLPGNGAYTVYDDTEKAITVVFVYGKSGSSAKNDLLFICGKNDTGKAKDDKGDDTDTQVVYRSSTEGEVVLVESKANQSGFYSYAINEASGRYELSKEFDDLYYYSGISADCVNAGAYIFLQGVANGTGAGADLKVTSDTMFYDLTDNGIAGLSSLENACPSDHTAASFAVLALYDSKAEYVKEVYIIDKTTDYIKPTL